LTVMQIEAIRIEIEVILIATGNVTRIIVTMAIAVTARGTPVKTTGTETAAETKGMVTAVGTKGIVTAAETKGIVTAAETKGMVTAVGTVATSMEAESRPTLVETKGMEVVGTRGLVAEAIPTEMQVMLAMRRATIGELKLIAAGTLATSAETRASARVMRQTATGILAMEAGSKLVIGEMMVGITALAGMLAGMPSAITVLAGMQSVITVLARMLAGSMVAASNSLIPEWRKPVAQMVWNRMSESKVILGESQTIAGERKALLWHC